MHLVELKVSPGYFDHGQPKKVKYFRSPHLISKIFLQ